VTGDASRDAEALLYHDVRPWHTFEEAASALRAVVAKAVALDPDRPRVLFVDVEGHRNVAGGFDHDMLELLAHFVPRALMPYLDEGHTPLCGFTNPAPRADMLSAPEIRLSSSQAGSS
jgi:hypothetical protein